MRDVMELLRAKEQELQKVKKQVEALRIVAPLLGSDEEYRHGSAAAGQGSVKSNINLG